MQTREQVEKLKEDWLKDPCWDLYDSEGFEEYREELKQFQAECEARWEKRRQIKEQKFDEEADKLGIRGLYRLIKQHDILLDRHQRAISSLMDGHNYEAYKILVGIDE